MADDVDARLRKVETNQAAILERQKIEIDQATILERQADFERRLKQVDQRLIWTSRLVVGGIIVAVMDAFILRWLSERF